MALLVVCLLLAGGYLLVRPRQEPGVTRANVARVQKGMTEAEVDAIFAGRKTRATEMPGVARNTSDRKIKHWYGSAGEVAVYFDAGAKVDHKDFVPSRPPTFVETLQGWLGW